MTAEREYPVLAALMARNPWGSGIHEEVRQVFQRIDRGSADRLQLRRALYRIQQSMEPIGSIVYELEFDDDHEVEA